nr:hypothetical protein [Crucivirus sp.]
MKRCRTIVSPPSNPSEVCQLPTLMISKLTKAEIISQQTLIQYYFNLQTQYFENHGWQPQFLMEAFNGENKQQMRDRQDALAQALKLKEITITKTRSALSLRIPNPSYKTLKESSDSMVVTTAHSVDDKWELSETNLDGKENLPMKKEKILELIECCEENLC